LVKVIELLQIAVSIYILERVKMSISNFVQIVYGPY